MTHIGADPLLVSPLVSVEDPGAALLRDAILQEFPGRLAIVSSFGADSAMLLALVAEIDRSVPVLFLDTGMHFPETLAYRDWLARRLGLTDLRSLHPDAMALRAGDPDGDLHRYLPDDCCALRKVAPLRAALAPFAAWVTGQRREQSPGRAALPLRETVDGRIKLNPLADWSAARVAAELDARDLPRHPLLARGYRSIGCFPCTRPTRPDEDPRAGRWPGLAKTECGIHRPGVFKSEPHPA